MTLLQDGVELSATTALDVTASLKRSRVALYLQLADLFRNRITSGYWPVGSRIPSVDELEMEFGVARGTIRQAFDLLAEEGLVDRRRAKGSFVLRAPPVSRVHRLDMDWASITKAHQGAQIQTLSDESGVALPEVLQDGSPNAPAYRHFTRLHRRDGQAYLLGYSYLDERLYARIKPSRFESEPLLVLLQEAAAEMLGPANQTLIVGVADIEMANTLEVNVNSPVVIMYRRVHAVDGTLIYASEGIYRGDGVRLEMTIR